MVKVYTSNGYVVSIIQSNMGKGTAIEVAVWARDVLRAPYLQIGDIDMMFMYSEQLEELLKEVHKLPVKEKNFHG